MRSIINQLLKGKNDYNEDEVLYLNKDEEDEMEIRGYERSFVRSLVTWTFVFITLGSLRLVLHWYQHWLLYCTHCRCPLKYAKRVLIISKYQGSYKTFYVAQVRRLCLEKASLEDKAIACNDLDKENMFASNIDADHSVRVHFNDGSFSDESNLIIIKVKKLTYIWNDDKKQFCKLVGLEKGIKKSDLHNIKGYTRQQQMFRRIVYGLNEIKVKVDSYCTLIIMELFTPFYMFQIFSLILWIWEVYLYYAGIITAISCFGIILATIQLRKNQEKLFDTVQTQGRVSVYQRTGVTDDDFNYKEVPIKYLVPGDIIAIPRCGFICPCDAVLLNGNCIVNESMLTGECVPVKKTALPCIETPYDEKLDANHTLYCGTEILQARYIIADKEIHAVVLRTGFMTTKGNLILSIMYPIPYDFIFDRDCYKFVGILVIIAAIGSIVTAYFQIKGGIDTWDTIISSLDIITIVVPPALPATISVGKYYGQKRLLNQRITCMNTAVINVSGSVNCVCFDKTGTLTEDSLDLYGVMPSENQQLLPVITEYRNSNHPTLNQAMASCHSLTFLHDEITGDPLDVKMFEATGWTLYKPELTDTVEQGLSAATIVKSPRNDREIRIVHQYQFSSSLQRMSVIIQHPNSSDLIIYCKGSPEMIASLCTPQSVPQDLNTVLEKQTEKGYRVIAIAYKNIPPINEVDLKKLGRDQIEIDLVFAGLIIFENKLKAPTTSVISSLKQGGMKIIMVTGDHIQTAIYVARECGIVGRKDLLRTVNITISEDSGPRLTFTTNNMNASKYTFGLVKIVSVNDMELGSSAETNQRLAMTGRTWRTICDSFPSQIPRILQNVVIFARMSSDQKQQVIQEFQKMGYCVAMCGDGANDCAALKTADIGISLSEAEASVASPFTSQQADIACVPTVIREGRAALVTAFGLFKFMIVYSLLECFSVILLFSVQSKLSDLEFLYIDAFLILTSAFFFGRTKPYKGQLVPKAPNSRLLSAIPLMSILTQIIINFGFQAYSQYLIHLFPWYKHPLNKENIPQTYDNFAVYNVSQYQYIIIAITYSFGKPYRQSMFKNVPFFISVLVLIVTSLYITIMPSAYLQDMFELLLPPLEFRSIVCTIALINFVSSIIMETFIINYFLKNILQIDHKEKLNFNDVQKLEESYLKVQEE